MRQLITLDNVDYALYLYDIEDFSPNEGKMCVMPRVSINEQIIFAHWKKKSDGSYIRIPVSEIEQTQCEALANISNQSMKPLPKEVEAYRSKQLLEKDTDECNSNFDRRKLTYV